MMSTITFDQLYSLPKQHPQYGNALFVLSNSPNIIWELPSFIIRIINKVNSKIALEYQLLGNSIEHLNQLNKALNDYDTVHYLLFDIKTNVQKVYVSILNVKCPVSNKLITITECVKTISLNIIIKSLLIFKKILEKTSILIRIESHTLVPAMKKYAWVFTTADIVDSIYKLYTVTSKAKTLYYEMNHLKNTLREDALIKKQVSMLQLQLVQFSCISLSLTCSLLMQSFSYMQLSLIAHSLYIVSLSSEFLYDFEVQKQTDLESCPINL